MNKLITKFKQNRTANARKQKHQQGGILKAQEGTKVDLTPINLERMLNNYKLYGNNRYIDTLLLRQLDNRLIKHNVGLPQRQAIAITVQQEGNTTKSHGNGAFGLVGWRGKRAENLPSTINGQADKLYNETYGEFNSDNWNHGGRGSGYNSGRDAQKAFQNAETVGAATRALNFGYVRPPLSDRIYRENSSNKIFKKGGSLSKKSKGAFVPGHDIADSNPKAYKYVKKHYKMKGEFGGNLPDLSTYIQNGIDKSFDEYTKNGNVFSIWQQSMDEAERQRKLQEQSEQFQMLAGLGEKGFNYLANLLSNRIGTTSFSSNKSFTNTSRYTPAPIAKPAPSGESVLIKPKI